MEEKKINFESNENELDKLIKNIKYLVKTNNKFLSIKKINEFKLFFIDLYPKLLKKFEEFYEKWMKTSFDTLFNKNECEKVDFTYDKFLNYYIKFDPITPIIDNLYENMSKKESFYITLYNGSNILPIIDGAKYDLIYKSNDLNLGLNALLHKLDNSYSDNKNWEDIVDFINYYQSLFGYLLLKKLILELNEYFKTDFNKYGELILIGNEEDTEIILGFNIKLDEMYSTNKENENSLENHEISSESYEIKYDFDTIKNIYNFSKENMNLGAILSKSKNVYDDFDKIKHKSKEYKCPVCKKAKYTSMKHLYTHVLREHQDEIPDQMPVEQFIFNLRNKKTHGTCVICKRNTEWNPKTNKYHRFCSEKCKNIYVKEAKERLKRIYGTDDLSKNPEHQKKMLNSRKISSPYIFSDKTTIMTNSSYEIDFLEFNEFQLGFTGKDIISCDIVFEYEFEGKTHFYMPDFYIPDLNLIIEVKEKGSNAVFIPRMREMDLCKIEAVIKSEKYNFITVCGKEYDKYVEVINYLKNKEFNTNDDNKLIIEIDKENYGSINVPQKFIM